MKPWIKRTFFGALGLTALAGGLAACGHHHGGYSDERVTEMRGKAVERVAGKLDLNAEQKQKLNLLADELLAQRKAIKGDGTPPRAAMGTLIAGEKFDRSRAQTLVDEKTRAIQAGAPKLVTAMADFYDSLNAAQQKELREKLQERRHWWSRG